LGVLGLAAVPGSLAQTPTTAGALNEEWTPPRASTGPMVMRRSRMENPPEWTPPPRVADAAAGKPAAPAELAPAPGPEYAPPAAAVASPRAAEPAKPPATPSVLVMSSVEVAQPPVVPAVVAAVPTGGVVGGMHVSVQLANVPSMSAQAWLSEDEAVVQALAHHSGLEVWRQKSVAAAAMLETASVLNAPILKMGRSDDIQDVGADSRKNRLGVQWTPPQPGETRLRKDVLVKRKDEAVALQTNASQRLVAEVRGLHASVRILSAMLDEAVHWTGLLTEQNSLVSEQVKAQRRTQFDWVDAELKLADAIARRARIRQERDQAMSRLLAVVGQPPGLNPPWTIAPESVHASVARVDVTDVAPLLAAARQARPDVAALAARCDGVVAETRLLEMENRIWFKELQVTVGQQPNQPSSWGVQVGITVPLTGPKNGGPAVAVAQRATCVAEQGALEQSIQQEVQAALVRYDTAWSAWNQHITQVLPLTERAVNLGRQTKALGRLEGTEMLALELRHADARMTALSRLLDVRQAALAMALATGSVVVP
jgi:outer membrane protein TolC